MLGQNPSSFVDALLKQGSLLSSISLNAHSLILHSHAGLVLLQLPTPCHVSMPGRGPESSPRSISVSRAGRLS